MPPRSWQISDRKGDEDAPNAQQRERPPYRRRLEAKVIRQADVQPVLQLADQREECPGRGRNGYAQQGPEYEQPHVGAAAQQCNSIGRRAQLRSPPVGWPTGASPRRSPRCWICPAEGDFT